MEGSAKGPKSEAETHKRVRQILTLLVPVILLGIASALLYHILRHQKIQDIAQAMASIPSSRLWLALGLTALNYTAMSGYDYLSLRYVAHPLPYRKIALASFIGYAFANNTGSLSFVTSGGIRYRLYSGWGVSPADIGKVIAFSSISFWIGFLWLSGFSLAVGPSHLGPLPYPSSVVSHSLGVGLLLLSAGYLLLVGLRGKEIHMFGWTFPPPRRGLLAGQLAISSIDWLLAALVLYALLSPAVRPPVPVFVALYLLAQLAGLLSAIPGGLGVFESVFLVLTSPALPASEVAACLVAYRLIYYLIPLGMAGVLLGLHEIARQRSSLRKFSEAVGPAVGPLGPAVLSVIVLASGGLLVLSGVLPSFPEPSWLHLLLPGPVHELSHFMGSLVGTSLLVLSWGLRRRLDAAYFLGTITIAAGIVFSLLKGPAYGQALWLTVLLGVLVACRRQFYRRASLLSEPFSPRWTLLIATVLLSAIGLALFAHRHVSYSGSLWWQFALKGDTPRALRATVGALTLALAFALAKLLHPSRHQPPAPKMAELTRAEAIAAASPDTTAYLALLGDKHFIFSESQRSFIMYAISGNTWIAMGDPVGQHEEMAELLWSFQNLCDRHNGRPVFYEAGAAILPLYLDLGLSALKIGEEAKVALPDFGIQGSDRKGLRHSHRRAVKEGCVFEAIPREKVPDYLPEMQNISDQWLRDKNTKEKGFSLGFFSREYLSRFPAALIWRNGQLVAFANILPGGGHEEVSIDLMRHTSDAPPGVMDFLFVELMLWGKAEGYQWFNLGMAPLAGLEARAVAPLWTNVGAFVFRHGAHFYNFRGLRAYKAKFAPTWRPKYLVSPGGLALPQIMLSVTTLISRGPRGIIRN